MLFFKAIPLIFYTYLNCLVKIFAIAIELHCAVLTLKHCTIAWQVVMFSNELGQVQQLRGDHCAENYPPSAKHGIENYMNSVFAGNLSTLIY